MICVVVDTVRAGSSITYLEYALEITHIKSFVNKRLKLRVYFVEAAHISFPVKSPQNSLSFKSETDLKNVIIDLYSNQFELINFKKRWHQEIINNKNKSKYKNSNHPYLSIPHCSYNFL